MPENFVSLEGPIVNPNFRKVSDDVSLFKGKVAGVNIIAWRNYADTLSDVPIGVPVKIHGHIEEKSYDSKCYHCGGYIKKYWTDVVVDNFMIVSE
jgi:hypothetical protein